MPVNNGPTHAFSLRARALRARSQPPSRGLCGLLPVVVAASSIALATWLAASVASADEPRTITHHVEPPPAPEEHPPTLSVEVHGGAEVPLERGAICPAAAGCVLGAGVVAGVRIERRSSDRVGLFAGYDFWLLDSDGVFELGALHAVRAGIRYVLDDSMLVHPFIEGAIGFLAFGDTANVVTLGGLVSAGAGAELELSESVAFVTSLEAWFLSTGPFTTREGATRADPFGVNIALQITIGVSVLVGPSAAAR